MATSEDDGDPVRRAAQYRVDREAARERVGSGAEPEDDSGEDSGEERRIGTMSQEERSRFVDTVIDQAIRRGEFDNLPLEGKPIPGIKGAHDPDWWVKNLVEREKITGVLPAAQLRHDAAGLADQLDREVTEERVREIVEEFNARVIDARRQLTGGPPVVTPTRDVDAEVAQWRARREARRAARGGTTDGRRTTPGEAEAAGDDRRRKPWWRPW
ncbi:DUF1992 domain-containing protein [Myceligenerans pegani]|uniref:DUF1992 domain-containing protein n=1 Tax=Myceligenerans pegani TaxID=2776917 RepID=A0ABR9N5F9_9MICO|nr:DUF1992 domain-containing protein [Myceligenerans sp. TRM 65318]MBE1878227.1 DUF1992 domain-containing protein [Myceligenerans sp. TRM 65318]MBE3020498.1 DUF1992 domain-containing protein [Myceligenerans sp. TRM 65318]